MQKFMYYAVITPNLENGGYIVQFPNLSNIYTYGETLLEVMIDYKEQFSAPSPVSEITIKDGESLIAVEVDVTPQRTAGDSKQ